MLMVTVSGASREHSRVMSMRSNLKMPGLTLCRRDGEFFSLRDFGGRKRAMPFEVLMVSRCATAIGSRRQSDCKTFYTMEMFCVNAQVYLHGWPPRVSQCLDLSNVSHLIPPMSHLHFPQMDRNRYGRIFELNPQSAVVERA